MSRALASCPVIALMFCLHERTGPAGFYERATTWAVQELMGRRLCRRLADGRLLAARVDGGGEAAA